MITRKARKALRASRNHAATLSKDPYYQGDTARHAGLTESANPYDLGTNDSVDWLAGYREAMHYTTTTNPTE